MLLLVLFSSKVVDAFLNSRWKFLNQQSKRWRTKSVVFTDSPTVNTTTSHISPHSLFPLQVLVPNIQYICREKGRTLSVLQWLITQIHKLPLNSIKNFYASTHKKEKKQIFTQEKLQSPPPPRCLTHLVLRLHPRPGTSGCRLLLLIVWGSWCWGGPSRGRWVQNRQAGSRARRCDSESAATPKGRREWGCGVGEWAVQSVPGPALHHRADAALKHNGGIFDDADRSQSRIASVYFLQQTTPGVWRKGGGDWQRIQHFIIIIIIIMNSSATIT